MADEAITPGDNPTPPVEPAAPAASNPEPAPSGSEPENNAGKEPAMVPSDRLREETEKRRKAEEELEQLKNQPPTTPPVVNQDDELDPETEKILDSYAKKRGLVSKEELDAQETAIRVQQDVRDLETNSPVAGIPYDHKAVMEYAKDNNLPVTSKSALEAAYMMANKDQIFEAERNRAIEGFKTSGSSGAEKPGSQGAQPPGEQEVTGSNPKERTRNRIGLARQKLNA